ncbi:hypothetical protein RchiOBHm_Chr1g0340541 [Rosa chinensis]|uniref:Pentatricopeptide n=1 Tax=Rosa chinensis TaxID=74649 RepID=A0A2P6SDI7_ROSCH|nr:hypothetical protein RchiOBHm_Chr1g0340541 [Rosa chinensis]
MAFPIVFNTSSHFTPSAQSPNPSLSSAQSPSSPSPPPLSISSLPTPSPLRSKTGPTTSKYHPGFHHNCHTYHVIICRLLRSRAFHLIDPLLSDLRSLNLRCIADLFISLICNYSVVSRPKLALKTFITIPKFGVQRSVRSLNALLNALVQNH